MVIFKHSKNGWLGGCVTKVKSKTEENALCHMGMEAMAGGEAGCGPQTGVPVMGQAGEK